MYYALILLSVVMFGASFAMNDAYRKMRGSGFKISFECSLIAAVPNFFILLALNGFRFEYTPFSLAMAVLAARNGLAFGFCSFKALGKINLSLYSLFSMLGGMALPFLQGIVFYGEPLTVAKAVCFLFIVAALLLTLERGEKKNGTVYYIGIFLLNGMSGVISKIFTATDLPKTSAAGYSLLTNIATLFIAVGVLLVLRKQQTPKHSPLSVGVAAAKGIISRLANLLLIMSLAHVDASVQYPMVTGGTMIVSTLIAFFDKNRKPSKKELVSVALAFLGTLALFVIPV